MIKRLALVASVAVTVLLAMSSAHADSNLFAYSHGTAGEPQGEVEVEQYLTYRKDKSEGKYDLLESKTELEYGVTRKWLVSLVVNSYGVKAKNNNSQLSRNDYNAVGDGDEVTGGGPATFGSYVPNIDTFPVPSAEYRNSGFVNAGIESIYQHMSPNTDDPFGLSSYVEYLYGPHEKEAELKMLIEKNLYNNRLTLLANVGVEIERESWSRKASEKEATFTFSGGASYKLNDAWHTGLEFVNERGFEGSYSLNNKFASYSTWSLGPNFSYSGHNFSVVGAWLHQLPLATAYNHAAENELIGSRDYFRSEKNQFRLVFNKSF
jgi:hypothetical protein